MSKRLDYLKWDDFFVALSMITAQHRTKCSDVNTALILNYRRIIIGIGCENDKNSEEHVTIKALNEAKPFMRRKKQCTMYITRLPCGECIATIAENGIKEVIYVNEREDNHQESLEKLKSVGISYRKFQADKSNITLDIGQFCD